MKKIFSTFFDIEEYRQDFLDTFCEQPTDEALYDFCNDLINNDFMELKAEMQKMKGVYIIEGYLGLWDGKHKIIPIEDSLINLFNKATYNSDDIEVFYNEKDKIYNVKDYHHDGCNVFYISPKK